MGIQINGSNDTISASDGSLSLPGADLTTLTQVNVTGVGTFANLVVSGNASIGGTVTYMDVTNVDSVGIITAQQGIQVLANGINITGVSTVAAGTTAAPSISPTGDSNTGIFFPAADTIAFAEGGVESMRIDSSGRLAIGTTAVSSGSILQTKGDSSRHLSLQYSGTAGDAETLIQFRDKNDAVNAAIGNNLENDGVGAAAARLVFKTASSGSLSERARIDSSGRLLVGTSSAYGSADNFVVQKTDAGARIGLQRSDTGEVTAGEELGAITFYSNDGDLNPSARISAEADLDHGAGDKPGRLVFSTTADGASSPTERMRITNAGNIQIGTTSSSTAKLEVIASAAPGGSNFIGYFKNTYSGDVSYAGLYVGKYDNNSTTSQVLIRFSINNDTSGQGQINGNGAAQAAFGTFSDSRLKENIIDLPSQWDSIKFLRPVEFDYIESEGGGHQIGFIAQDVKDIYPDVVGEREDGMLTLSGMGKNESRLIKALQEAMERIEQLEAKVAALESA